MTNAFNNLPEKIQRQIASITKYSSLQYNNDSIEKIALLWIKKEEAFKEELKKQNMLETDYIELNNKNACIIMTYSGSLLKIGPEINKKRQVEYTSIGLRKDVPDHLLIDNVILGYDIIKDEPIDFFESRIKTTSPVYKIGICRDDSPIKDQTDTINKATDFILYNFIELNREYIDKEK